MKEWLINENFDFKKIPYLNKDNYQEITQLFEGILKEERSPLFPNQTMAEVLLYKEVEDETSTENIRNWLRYRIINLLLGSNIFDCESSSEAKEVYRLLGWNQETAFDNINSFQTIWTTVIGKFCSSMMNQYYKNEKNEYELFAQSLLMKANSLLFNKSTLATKLWQLHHVEDFQIPTDILNELSRLAHNTHTIGNFMPCPEHYYNHIKGNFENDCDDRIDLILTRIKNFSSSIVYRNYYNHTKKYLTKEELEKILNWFNKDKIDTYLLGDYLKWNGKLIINSPNSLNRITKTTEKDDIYYYLKYVNNLIKKRSHQVFSKL